MAKFSQAFLRQAASPGMFGLGVAGLGSQLGTALQERRQREEQMQAQQQQMTLMNQSIAAAEQGDTRALTANRNKIMELLSVTQDEATRNSLMDTLNQLNAARPAAQKQSTTNTANAIIKTEQAIKQFDSQTGPLSENEQRAKEALEQRLQVMRQNGQAVVEADNIQLAAQLKALTDQEQLNTARTKAAVSELSKFVYGSDDYKTKKAEFVKAGLNDAVQKYEKIQMEYQQTRLELQELRDKRTPLTEKQKKFMRDNNQVVTGSVVEDRITYFNFVNSQNEATRAIALRNLAEVSGDEAKAAARLALLSMQQEPGAEVSGPEFWQDLNDEIDALSEDDLQEIYDLTEGKTPVEINQVVRGWIQTKFKSEFDDMMQFQQQQEREQNEKEASIDAVIAATNARRKANGESELDPNDPAVRAGAWEEAQAAASEQRALRQAQGVGGRVL